MSHLAMYERLLAMPDAAQLRQLGASQAPGALADLLDEAEIVRAPELPADAVRLDATVEFEDLAAHRRQTLVLSLPERAEPAEGRVSVLSPVGLALIGLRAGATAQWLGPLGDACSARIVSVWPPPQE